MRSDFYSDSPKMSREDMLPEYSTWRIRRRHIFLALLSALALLLSPTSVPAVPLDPAPELLEISDFNQDGEIDEFDENCLDLIVNNEDIPLDCLEVYNLSCEELKGDLNTNGVIDKIDLILEKWMVDGRINSTDFDQCADMTNDGIIDESDLACMVGMVEGNMETVEDYCTPCQKKATEAGRYGDEICHDGYDNDCDGQTDEDCVCDESQSCEAEYDNDGLASTEDFKYCRSLSWENGGAYEWYWPEQFTICTMDLQCHTKACDGKEWTCSSKGGTAQKGEWFEGELPEETDDPDDSPRTCQDGWDNDCEGGDEECEQDDSGVFNWVVAIVVAVILTIITILVAGPLGLAALEIGASIVGNILTGVGAGFAAA